MDRPFDAPMDDAFDERVKLALKVLASVYGRPNGTTVMVNEIRTLKSYLGAEDWTGMPLDQVGVWVRMDVANVSDCGGRTKTQQRHK